MAAAKPGNRALVFFRFCCRLFFWRILKFTIFHRAILGRLTAQMLSLFFKKDEKICDWAKGPCFGIQRIPKKPADCRLQMACPPFSGRFSGVYAELEPSQK